MSNDELKWFPKIVSFPWDQALLKCPVCDGDYLHQGTVRIYDRAEDDPSTYVTTVAAQDIVRFSISHVQHVASEYVPTEKSHNPSERRHGVSIEFECEGCGGPYELTFAQHKGFTFVRWRHRTSEAGKVE